MRNLFLFLSMGALALYGVKFMSKPKLRYFSAGEFGVFYPLINSDLLIKLDEFRHRWGRPVVVSPVAGAIVRHGGDSHSQHNIDRWGETRAVDVFPDGMDTVSERKRAYQIARDVGFTGIGIYTDTVPSNLLHVDVRPGGYVATWSRVGGQYLEIGEVLV